MDAIKKVIDAISEIGRSRVLMNTFERQLEAAGSRWIEELARRMPSSDRTGSGEDEELAIELAGVVESLRTVRGTPQVDTLLGRTLGLLLEIERSSQRGRKLMRRLVGQHVASQAEAEKKRLLVFSPGTSSTRLAWFEGLDKVHEEVVHLSPDVVDSVEARVDSIRGWLAEKGLELAGLHGIAGRCGFVQPVPSGTYRIVPEMLADIGAPPIEHPSNMALHIAERLAELSGRRNQMLLTTTDPVVVDELETVSRLTGFAKIRRENLAAHYLNHKAVWRLLASLLGRQPQDVGAVTAHLSGGMSVALHREGRVVDVLDAFSGMPSTSRCGPIDLLPLLAALQENRTNIKELEAMALQRGGLLSLAGTNDFRALINFRHQGANEEQRKKINLLLDFFARQASAGILRLTAGAGGPVQVVAITGGIAHSDELIDRIDEHLAGRFGFPVVQVPGTLSMEALAAGLIEGLHEPGTLKDYVRERDALHARRREEARLLDTVVFERRVIFRKEGAPIVSLDDLIDETCLTVQRNFVPTIGIVGAENEEAILASKMANEEGTYRLAKFRLLGDYSAISKIAYDYDLVIDDDNYAIVDTEDPVEEATRLFDAGQIHVLMKGSMKTENILRGVFRYLKASGRLKQGELISHVVVLDIPKRNKLVAISDAAVNTYPDEEKRVKIIDNALKVAKNLNIRQPKVAIISAIESVNKSVESSLEAERIAKRFAGRPDCIVEGPLSFDVAMDAAIAHEKKYRGEIKGNADILIMPDIDAGNVAYKSLTTQSGATVAGVILCGDMPMVLTSRGDSARSKLASISLAVNLYFHLRKNREVSTESVARTEGERMAEATV